MQYYYKQYITPMCYNSNCIRNREGLHLREKWLNYNLWHNIVSHHTNIKCFLEVFVHLSFCKETEMHIQRVSDTEKVLCPTHLTAGILQLSNLMHAYIYVCMYVCMKKKLTRTKPRLTCCMHNQCSAWDGKSFTNTRERGCCSDIYS